MALQLNLMLILQTPMVAAILLAAVILGLAICGVVALRVLRRGSDA